MIYFVDLEASSLLPVGFPIEIGWVDQDGPLQCGALQTGESHLIRPSENQRFSGEEWLDGGYGWSHRSEAVHGISLETLVREGTPPDVVAKRVADVLAETAAFPLPRRSMTFSDAPGYDGGWLETLLAEGGQGRSVRLLGVTQAYGWACRPLLDGTSLLHGRERETAERLVRAEAIEIVANAQQAEAMRPRVRHRALPDAEGLWWTWRRIQDVVASRERP